MCLLNTTFTTSSLRMTTRLRGSYFNALLRQVIFNVYMATQSITLCVPHVEVFAAARAASIFYMLERELEIDSLSIQGVSPRRVVENISLENVDFSYPLRPDVMVLKVSPST